MKSINSCSWIGMILVTTGIFFIGNVKSESGQEKENIVCKQKVLWKMRMCPDGKLICSKNREYVDKARRYIKALGSPNHARRVKAYYKLTKIAHYILPYIKEEYKRVKNFEQMNALIGYRSLDILKDVQIKIMCEDGKGSFMWYAVILKGAVKTFAPWGFVSLGFILVGNETGVIEGVQVRGLTNEWIVSNYSCDLRDKSRTKFAIEISDGEYNYVVTENTYYKNSKIYPSPSNNFYIIVKSERGKEKAVINGKESEEYNNIEQVTFSPSGNRYGFAAVKENGKWVVVIDGKESEKYNYIGRIAFSSSGSRYGFVAQKENGEWVPIIDGQGSEKYRWAGQIVFSSSGNRYGFVAQKENSKWVAVIDGKESEEYNGVGEIAFSSSGSRYGFVAQKENGKWVAVIDGKESGEYNSAWPLVFSSSGNRYGFVAQKENSKWVAVIDGKESGEYYYITQISFNSSGSRYEFVAQKENGKWVAVIDGKESKEYNGVWSFVFSSSGSRYGFVAAKSNGKQVAVTNGKESEEHSVIGVLVFSSSGKRNGLVAQKENGKWVAVIDGGKSKEYDKIVEYTRMGRWGLTFYNILSWSSNDKLSTFVGRIKRIGENDMCEIVVNNHPVRTTNCTPDFYFHKNTLKFIEFRSNKIYSVSCKSK